MIIRLEPIAFSKVWGGDKLSKIYNKPIDKVGEIWGISAHKSHSNIINNGQYKGMTFRNFYKNHREHFGNYHSDEFPLLFKIIDAKEDLSIQVHPDDEYALKYEDSLGKDECWYILDANNNARIQLGHKAKNREEILNAIQSRKINTILNYVKVYKNDYFYVPSGKVHAICKDITLLEVSQSSDITYRLYDYDRLDNGKMRELHLEKSLNVINIPDKNISLIHKDKYFSFNIFNFSNQIVNSDKFGDYLYILEGKASIDEEIVKKGDFLILTSLSKHNINGNIKVAQIRILK